ncbi:MAG TPA: VOC family protein [Streptosporangiaceae bacterium]
MTAWDKEVGAIVLFTEDLAAAKAFYAEVFGQPLVHEDETSAVFKFPNTMVLVVDASSAAELVTPTAVGPGGSGPRSMLSVFVPDVDAVCAELAAKGVRLLNGPVDRRWGMRTAAFADPAGHVWEVAQEIASGQA